MLQSKPYTCFPRNRKSTDGDYFCTPVSLKAASQRQLERPLPLTQLKEGPRVELESLLGRQTNE